MKPKAEKKPFESFPSASLFFMYDFFRTYALSSEPLNILVLLFLYFSIISTYIFARHA